MIVALTFHPLQIIQSCDCSAGSVSAIYISRRDDLDVETQATTEAINPHARNSPSPVTPSSRSITTRPRSAYRTASSSEARLVYADNEAIASGRLLRTSSLSLIFVVQQWPCWLPNPRFPPPWEGPLIKTPRPPTATTTTTTESMAVLPNPNSLTLLECLIQ